MNLIPGRKLFQNVPPGLPRWCLFLGLFLLICGAKFWLIHTFGNATPSYDEWDSEARVITSYVEGRFSPLQFFEPHNEHHIVFTQMLMLSLFCVNKLWDPILQMVGQAPVHVIAIVAFVSLAGSSMSSLGRTALAAFAGCLGIIPFGWENTLWGDQSCFYFSLLFGVVVIWICWRYEPLTPCWWLGAVLGFAGLFTMASGTFSIMALTAFQTARLILERDKNWKRQIAAAAILAAIAIFGVMNTPDLTTSGPVIANTLGEFIWALTGILSWPCNSHWACIVIQAPLILLVLVSLFRRVSFNDGRWYVIIAGADFWIQALATSYRRGNGWTASRYCDSWAMLAVILAACLYFLRGSPAERRPFLFYTLAAVWLSVCLYGILDCATNLLPRQITDFHSILIEEESNVREYLITGDVTYLQGKIPLQSPEKLRQILSSETIRHLLPSNLVDENPPLIPIKQTFIGDAFVPNGYPNGMPPLHKAVFGSYGKSGIEPRHETSLQFKVPRGARQAELQIAGYPNAVGVALEVMRRDGTYYSIAPVLDSGDYWQSVFIRLDPKSTTLKIRAKDTSEHAWIAFSMPAVSGGHAPGRWARAMTCHSLAFLDVGMALMILGALGELAERTPMAPISPIGPMAP